MSLTTLRHALVAHRFDEAERILEQEQLDLNAQDLRLTPLLWAVDKRDVAMAQWLIAHGADVNKNGGPHRETPLGAAVRIGVPDMVDYLIEVGVDLEQPDEMGMTPLMRALQHASRSTMLTRRLLKAGANPNAQTARDADTPLMIAVSDERLNLIPDLAAAGADPELATKEGRTALHAVVKTHRQDLLNAFLAAFPNVDLNRATKSGLTALSQSQAPEITMTLLRAGADPAVRSVNPFDDGRTPLMHLLRSSPNGEEIALALRLGAPVADQDFKGKTNLGYAIEAGNLRGIELLYRKGLPVDSPANREGLSPYHVAVKLMQDALVAQKKHEEKMASSQAKPKSKDKGTDDVDHLSRAIGFWAVLRDLKVPVDLPRVSGPCELPMASPLVMALDKPDSFVTVSWLLDAGADVNQRGPNGRTAAHALAVLDARLTAEIRRQEDIHRRIKEAQEEVRDPPLTEEEMNELVDKAQRASANRSQARGDFEQAFVTLSQAGIEWDIPDNRGWNAMEMAIREGAAQLATTLVCVGEDPLKPLSNGLSAPALALYEGRPLVLLGLLAAMDQQGIAWVPSLDDLVLATPEGYPQRAHFLEALQALSHLPQWSQWLGQKDEQGNSALLLAAATGQEDLVELFLNTGLADQVNEANVLGETPLLHAAAQKEPTIVRLLLAAGADRATRTRSGVRAADLIEEEAYLREVWTEEVSPLPKLRDVPGLAVDQGLAARLARSPLPAPSTLVRATSLDTVIASWKGFQSPEYLGFAQNLLEQPLEKFGVKTDRPSLSTMAEKASSRPKTGERRPRP